MAPKWLLEVTHSLVRSVFSSKQFFVTMVFCFNNEFLLGLDRVRYCNHIPDARPSKTACKHPNLTRWSCFSISSSKRAPEKWAGRVPKPRDQLIRQVFFFQEATTGVYLLSYLELIFTKLTDGGSDQGQTNSSGSFAVFM